MEIIPFIVTAIEHNNITLIAREPIRFAITFNKNYQYFQIDKPELSIYIYAKTRELLLRQLNIYIAWTWKYYNLTNEEKNLKYKLRKLFYESCFSLKQIQEFNRFQQMVQEENYSEFEDWNKLSENKKEIMEMLALSIACKEEKKNNDFLSDKEQAIFFNQLSSENIV